MDYTVPDCLVFLIKKRTYLLWHDHRRNGHSSQTWQNFYFLIISIKSIKILKNITLNLHFFTGRYIIFWFWTINEEFLLLTDMTLFFILLQYVIWWMRMSSNLPMHCGYFCEFIDIYNPINMVFKIHEL